VLGVKALAAEACSKKGAMLIPEHASEKAHARSAAAAVEALVAAAQGIRVPRASDKEERGK